MTCTNMWKKDEDSTFHVIPFTQPLVEMKVKKESHELQVVHAVHCTKCIMYTNHTLLILLSSSEPCDRTSNNAVMQATPSASSLYLLFSINRLAKLL